MSISELRCFHAVAQTGSFSKAAALLLRAQPTITVQVAQLERRYLTELFHRRRGKKIQITDAGKQLHEITKPLFALELDALELLENGENLQSGQLKIGASFPNLPTQYILPFREKYPGVDVSLSLGNSESVYKDVKDCRVDIGFLGGNGKYPKCEVLKLSNPEIVLVAHKHHPFAQRSAVGIREILTETLLLREQGSETRMLFLNRLEKEGFQPGTTIEISSREGVCAAAGAGLGLGIIARDEIQDGFGIKVVQIEEFRIFGSAHFIALKERGYTKVIQAFRDVIEGIQQKLPPESR